MPSDPKSKPTLDYANFDPPAPKSLKIILGFTIGMLLGGIAANLGYHFLLNPNPKDDSLLILFELLAVQAALSFGIFTVSIWARLRKDNQPACKSVLIASVVGLICGMIPAAAFASPYHSIPAADEIMWILLACPVALPFVLFRKREISRSS